MAKFLLLIFLLYIAVAVFRFSRRVEISRQLIQTTFPFSYSPQKSGEGTHKRILVAGDSLAFGIGAVRPKDSLAGRLHQDVPDAEIVNVGKSGAKLKEVTEQIQRISGHVDLLLITGGANDIIRFRSLGRAESDAAFLLKTGKEKASRVVWIVSGNIGLAPLWPRPVGLFYSYRTRRYHAAFRSLAEREGAAFINLFKERSEDVFTKDPLRYYAPDGLHPSGEGYGVWYEQVKPAANSML